MKSEALPSSDQSQMHANALNDAQLAAFRTCSTLRFGDHLFIAGDTNFINEQHIGNVLIPPDVKSGWLQIIEDRHRRLTSVGATFLFVLAPDKQTVYRHILPNTYCCRPAAFLLGNANVVDPASALSAVAKLHDVYSRTDSHWNHFGALIAATAVLARLGLNLPPLSIRWVEQERLGDLGHKLNPVETSTLINSAIESPCRLIYDNCVANNGRIRIWSKPARLVSGKPRKLLILGDSFAYELVQFLKEAFDIVVHVHSFAMDYRVSDAFSPGFVLCEITERFLLRLPNPTDGEALTALWSDKVGRDERLEKPQAHMVIDQSDYCDEARAIADYAATLFAPFRAQLRTRD